MENAKNSQGSKKNFFQKYVYGATGKTLLTVFAVGAVFSILMPSLVTPPMVIIAVGITIAIQHSRKKPDLEK